jgi:hypothetical protein
MIDVAWSTNTRNVDVSVAPRYVAPGSGVARMRFSTPDSRRSTSVIASPPKAVFAMPYVISDGTR